jgi:very-short-patch-repair endonuclease
MTPQEVKLWVRLRELRTHGFHFRRQAPRDGYILDFLCISRGLIVEVDGNQHGFEREAARDARRDVHFAALGSRTLRFSNWEVDRNLDGVVETIFLAGQAATRLLPTRPASPATLPASGEG